MLPTELAFVARTLRLPALARVILVQNAINQRVSFTDFAYDTADKIGRVGWQVREGEQALCTVKEWEGRVNGA